MRSLRSSALFHNFTAAATLGVAIGASIAAPAVSRAGPASYESKHYTITSDLDRDLTIDIGRRADAMYDEYARRLSDFTPPAGAPRFELRLFDRKRDYLKLTGDRFSNTGGIFMSGRNILAVYVEEQGIESMRRTLQHEAFHQFAYTNVSPNLPVWLNEGLAQVFEEGIFTGKGFQLGEIPPRRVRQLQYDVNEKRLTPFRTFLALTDEQWQASLRDRSLAATHYNQSWAMVHFLVFAERNGKYLYRNNLVDWLRRIHNGEEASEAFKQAFSDNVEGFQSRFAEFARSLEPTPQARAVEHQTVLADLLIELRNRGKKFDTVQQFRDEVVRGRYRIQYSKGNIQWQTAEDPLVYFSDLSGKPYGPKELFFSPSRDGVLPDLIARPATTLPLATRFYRLDGKIERETLVEPARRR